LIHRIIVLSDHSPSSEQALFEAMKIGQIYRSIICCIHPTDVQDALSIKAASELRKKFEELVRSAGLEFEWRTADGDPASAVVSAVSTEGADLAVVGSLGEGGIKRQLLMSAAEKIVRDAPCDVLVVKRERPVF